MSEIKVRLSMEVPGATMLSSQDCEKMSKKDAYEHSTVTVEEKKKKGKKTVMEKTTLHINTRKSRPAKQVISLSREAFDYMIDVKEIPTSKLKKLWGRMSEIQRLDYHLGIIAEHFNAYSYSFVVFPD